MSRLFRKPEPPPVPDPELLPDTEMIDKNRIRNLKRMRASSGILKTQLQNNASGSASNFGRSTLGSS